MCYVCMYVCMQYGLVCAGGCWAALLAQTLALAPPLPAGVTAGPVGPVLSTHSQQKS